MQMRSYFYGAVTIALVVPVLIAVSYFGVVYREKSCNTLIKKNDEKEELLIFNDDFNREQRMEKLESANNPSEEYNFSIKLVEHTENKSSYNLVLTKIVATPNVDFNDIGWDLVKVNGDNYTNISSGTLANMMDGEVTLKEDININLGETQDFKLYYYLVGNNKYNRGSLSAIVNLEQE